MLEMREGECDAPGGRLRVTLWFRNVEPTAELVAMARVRVGACARLSRVDRAEILLARAQPEAASVTATALLHMHDRRRLRGMGTCALSEHALRDALDAVRLEVCSDTGSRARQVIVPPPTA